MIQTQSTSLEFYKANCGVNLLHVCAHNECDHRHSQFVHVSLVLWENMTLAPETVNVNINVGQHSYAQVQYVEAMLSTPWWRE
jgi:hypothetical protein